MNTILAEQLAKDYCCSVAEVVDHRNHFKVHQNLEGRRCFQVRDTCHLKVAVLNGKALFAGNEDIIDWCRNSYKNAQGAWLFEAEKLREIDSRLREDGYQINVVHPFFIAERTSQVDTGDYEIRWFEGDEIEQLRGDSRYDEAFSFDPIAPDLLGVAALRENRILGMAGASRDSPTMWQIGINVNPDARGTGIGTILVSLLKNELLHRNILPFYGTATSHIISQRLALSAGFTPAWAELITDRIGMAQEHKS